MLLPDRPMRRVLQQQPARRGDLQQQQAGSTEFQHRPLAWQQSGPASPIQMGETRRDTQRPTLRSVW